MRNNTTWNLKEEEVVGKVMEEEEDDFLHKVNNVLFCNKSNHTIDECYVKHGYPIWYKKQDSYMLMEMIERMNKYAIFIYKRTRKILR